MKHLFSQKQAQLLLIALSSILSACGSDSSNSITNATDHPVFKWTDAGVSNNYLPLGDTLDRTPAFIWPAYKDNGSRATKYKVGHQNINGSGWAEYSVPAAGAGCATGNSCSFTPRDRIFNVNDKKVWWVRGKVNGQWKEWSSAHVFKVVSATTPPTGGSFIPAGDTPTTHPNFKWPRVGSASRYEIGIETQTGTGWNSYTVSCSTVTCSTTPNYRFAFGNKMTWWVRPAGGDWSDGVDFNITQGTAGGDTQAPTSPSSLRKTGTFSSAASLHWGASSDNVGVAGYRIYRNGSQVGTTTRTRFTDSSLSASTRYTYTVQAFDAANNLSANSNNLVVTTEASGGGSTLKPFTWAPINNASSYTFGIENSNGSNWKEYIRTASQLRCQTGICSFIPSDYGLNVGDAVVWFVKPNGGDWSSSHFDTVTLTSGGGSDTQAPSVPANLRKGAVTASSILIRWNASSDNKAVTGYRVYRNGTQITTTSNTSFTDSSVSAATTYSYSIRAYDAANNVSINSSSLSVTTPVIVSGKKLLPPPSGKIYFGAFTDFGEPEDEITSSKIRAFDTLTQKPIAWSYFSNNWSNQRTPKISYPKQDIHTVHNLGKTPFIRLLPWVNIEQVSPVQATARNAAGTDLTSVCHVGATHTNTQLIHKNELSNHLSNHTGDYQGPCRNSFSMQSIIDGNWDNQLKQWAREANNDRDSNGKVIPLLVTFTIEMNGYWFPWSGIYNGGAIKNQYGDPTLADGPERFRDAYRHIIDLFKAEGTDHITWFFVPDTMDPNEDWVNFLREDWNSQKNYYPGDDYIDWIGTNLYGAAAADYDWSLFSSDWSIKHQAIKAISSTKPLALLEFGVIEDHPLGNKSAWFNDAFNTITNGDYLPFQAISYWNDDLSSGTAGMKIDSSTESLTTFRRLINDSQFISNLRFGQ